MSRAVALSLLALSLSAGGCLDAPKVIQGTVVSFEAGKTMVVKDERPPQTELTLVIDKAQIGAQPAPGDTVRVAYHAEASGARATRIANISRQAEIAGKKPK
jgi:hypothetical protein